MGGAVGRNVPSSCRVVATGGQIRGAGEGGRACRRFVFSGRAGAAVSGEWLLWCLSVASAGFRQEKGEVEGGAAELEL